MTPLETIVGAARLVERFGSWPSFHDAEVVRLALDRRGDDGPTAEMLVHTWAMRDEVDERGSYVLEKHTLVRFMFERLTACELFDFNQQNVLSGLGIESDASDGEAGFRVAFQSIWGMGGSLVCRRVVVAEVTPCGADGGPAGEG